MRAKQSKQNYIKTNRLQPLNLRSVRLITLGTLMDGSGFKCCRLGSLMREPPLLAAKQMGTLRHTQPHTHSQLMEISTSLQNSIKRYQYSTAVNPTCKIFSLG